MGNSDSLANPVKLRFLISTSLPLSQHRQGSPRSFSYGCPLRVTSVTREPILSFMVVGVKIDAPVFPTVRKRSTTPSCVSSYIWVSLTLRPAGLLDSLKEPLSGNLVVSGTPYTSLQLRGRSYRIPNGRTLTDKSYVLHGIPYKSSIIRLNLN